MKILFIEGLYDSTGAMDSDFAHIRRMNHAHELNYLKLDRKFSIIKKIKKIKKNLLKNNYDKVGFLSAKMSDLLIIQIVIGFDFFVYHYIPKNRLLLHGLFLRLLKRKDILFYSSGVKAIVKKYYGLNGYHVASRYIKKLDLCYSSVQKQEYKIFVPKAVLGIREKIDLKVIDHPDFLNKDVHFIVQQNINLKHDCSGYMGSITEVGFLSEDQYGEMLNSCSGVLIHLHSDYELRCSGMILDALEHQLVVYTNYHPTTISYGMPNNFIKPSINENEKILIKYKNKHEILVDKLCFESWDRFWKSK